MTYFTHQDKIKLKSAVFQGFNAKLAKAIKEQV